MPQRHETTPPWGKKRKRELSSSPSPPLEEFAPRDYEEIKRLKTEQDEARPPWARHSDPLSPSSLASSAAWTSSKNDDLTKAVRGMFDWTRSDEPDQESIRHMRRIVSLCQDEASWSGLRNWKRVIATYQSLGATPDDINDLIEAREPFWTQTRVRHLSSTLATPRALADSIRTMVEESERKNGRYLDRELKDQLIKAVDRVFPRAPPVLLNAQVPVFAPTTASVSAPASVPAPALGGRADVPGNDPASRQYQAPVAQMARTSGSSTANSGPRPQGSPHPSSRMFAPQQASSAPPPDPRFKSRPPGWAPSSDNDTKSPPSLDKPRTDSLTGSSSRKSSAATLILASPAEPSQDAQLSQLKPSSQHSRLPSPELPQVTKPKCPTRFATEAAKLVSTESSRNQRPPSPSPSPKLAVAAAPPIQFNIATGSNSATLRPRPRLDLDVEVARRTIDSNVFATPSSASSERRTSSALNLQPPTRPRSLPLFQAKIAPKEPSKNKSQQKKEILEACDYNKIPAQDTTPCPSDEGLWLLHFRDLADFHYCLGRRLIIRDISLTVLTYAPGQSFQTFAIKAPMPLTTAEGEIDMINAIARTFSPQTFILKRQTKWRKGVRPKWIVVFEEAIRRDTFVLDMTISGRREPLEFFALSSDCVRCWVCYNDNHSAVHCNFTSRIVLPHNDPQYLCQTPQLKQADAIFMGG